MIVPGEPVRARSGPDVTYDQVTELAAGTQLAIVGKNEAGDWWQVCCVDEQPVWVLGELVDEQGSLDAIAVAANIPPLPTPTATPIPKPAVVVSIPRVNARSGPSTDFPVLEQILQGTRLDVVGRTASNDWWQVCCVNGQPAWVAAEVVRTEGPVEAVALAELPTPTPQATPTQVVAAAVSTPLPAPVAGTYPFTLTEQTSFPFNGDYLRVGVKARDSGDQPLAGYALRVLNETTGEQWLSRQTTAGPWQFTAPSPAFDDFRQANLLFDTRGKASLTDNALPPGWSMARAARSLLSSALPRTTTNSSGCTSSSRASDPAARAFERITRRFHRRRALPGGAASTRRAPRFPAPLVG